MTLRQALLLTTLLAAGACIAPEDSGDEDSGDPSMQHILPLGDSITEGMPYSYRYPLAKTLSSAGVSYDFVGSHTLGADGYPDDWDRDNEGHAGWMTESIQAELPDWLPQYEVDIALIHLGTNDAGMGDVASPTAAMTAIIEQLRAHNPSVSICLAQILPFGTELENDPEFAGLGDFVQAWNSSLADVASDMNTSTSPIRLADMNSDFGNADLDDGVHPTEAGAEKMATEWFDCISRL